MKQARKACILGGTGAGRRGSVSHIIDLDLSLKIFFFETGPYYVALAGLGLVIQLLCLLSAWITDVCCHAWKILIFFGVNTGF
jgi:hypothetical protein